MNSAYERTEIEGETAIKPFYYLKNGLLHVRYGVDRCIELSENETAELKQKITEKPYNKQEIFSRTWEFMTKCVGKEVIKDGIREFEIRSGKC